MFLQILLNPEDQVFHRFLWRKDPQDKSEIYQFKAVIFGDAPSPFLACHVIKRVLEDHNGSNVDVFNALSRNLYMDDLLHSCISIAEAKDIVKGTCEVLEKDGFRMRNWIRNDQKILEEMTEERKNGCQTTRRRLAENASEKAMAAVAYLRTVEKSGSAEQDTVSVEELQEAEEWLSKQEQKKYYQRELQDLSNKKPLSKKSSIYDLSPFIDEAGLIRVGGRLRRASLEYVCRHQIILPKQSHLTELIIRETHEEANHFDANYVLNAIRSNYWPVQGRAMGRRTLRSCVVWKIITGSSSGTSHGRPSSIERGSMWKYLPVHWCRCFLAPLSPKQDTGVADGRRAQHMGGILESLVKLAKREMIAITKGAELTDEELMTVLTECKAMLNNRPLTYINNDPNDIEPLTPAHFLNSRCTTLIL
eukprot:gene14094-5082_t